MRTDGLNRANLVAKRLPDISKETQGAHAGRLNLVGMRCIEMPLRYKLQSGLEMSLPGKIDAYVSLDDPNARGIHMSRLYLELQTRLLKEPLNLKVFKELLERFVATHEGLSKESHLKIAFELPLERKALKSKEIGFRQYPVVIEGTLKDGVLDISLTAKVLYSSTCPCSAALARELVKEAFEDKFSDQDMVSKSDVLKWFSKEEAMAGVPHAQRSEATVKVKLNNKELSGLEFLWLIDGVENSLGTPVQSAVKREDEQEFSRLNAQNLMFCEDAARKLKNYLDKQSEVSDYYVLVDHKESLHPHDAVAVVVKGIEGGFRPYSSPNP